MGCQKPDSELQHNPADFGAEGMNKAMRSSFIYESDYKPKIDMDYPNCHSYIKKKHYVMGPAKYMWQMKMPYFLCPKEFSKKQSEKYCGDRSKHHYIEEAL